LFEQHLGVRLHQSNGRDDIDGAHTSYRANAERAVAVGKVDYHNSLALRT
jgi:hypothetical protein